VRSGSGTCLGGCTIPTAEVPLTNIVIESMQSTEDQLQWLFRDVCDPCSVEAG